MPRNHLNTLSSILICATYSHIQPYIICVQHKFTRVLCTCMCIQYIFIYHVCTTQIHTCIVYQKHSDRRQRMIWTPAPDIYLSHVSHINKSHYTFTDVRESSRWPKFRSLFKWAIWKEICDDRRQLLQQNSVTSPLSMCYVSHVNSPFFTCECIIFHIDAKTSSQHPLQTYGQVLSDKWTNHVWQINESCRMLAHAKKSSQYPLQHLDMYSTHPFTTHIHVPYMYNTHPCIIHVQHNCIHISCMGWLRLVGSINLWVSFAKETYKRDNIVQKRPII